MAEEYTVIDNETGAPLKVRQSVGSFKTPEQKLDALRKWFPDAESTSGTALGDDNFVYTDPRTNTPTLFNPAGLDWGDAIEWGREIVQIPAGVIGGAAALAAGQMGPQIFTPEEVVTVPLGAALASEGAGQIYDRAMDYMLPDPFSVKRGTPLDETITAASNVGMEMIGGRIAEAGLKKAGDLTGRAVRRALGVGKDKQAAGRILQQTAKDVGVELPTAGVLTQSPLLMFLEKRISQLPTGMVPLRNKFDKFRASTIEAAQNISRQYGSPLTEGGAIGGVVREGAKKTADTFRVKSGKLYDKVYDLAPSARGRLDNIMELRAELAGRLAKAEDSLRPSMQRSLNDMDGMIRDSQRTGGLELSAIREIRTNLRLANDDSGFGLVGMTKPESRYSGLVYDALTKDMNETVTTAGGKKAKDALSKADNYYKTKMTTDINPIVNEILKKDLDIQVFNFMMQGTKESNERLAGVLRNMPKETRDVVSASVIERMGMVSPAGQDIIEDFSTAKFLTNYGKLANSSKNSFFGKGSEHRENLDKLVDVFRNVQNAEAYTNTSKTGEMIGTLMTFAPFLPAGQLAATGNLVDASAAAVVASTGLLPPYYAGKLLSNEKVMNWLIKSGPKMVNKPNSVKFHLGRLMEITSRDTDLRDAAVSYIQALSNSMSTGGQPKADASAVLPLASGMSDAAKQKVIEAVQ